MNMATLSVGDKAPQIAATDQSGKSFDLSAQKGSKVVIYFYPKDDTPGCTAEACNIRDNYTDLLSKGYKVIGVSPDNLKSHVKFADKYELPFPLIPDPDKTIINAYGVWGPKKFLGKSYEGVLRTTFIVNEVGNIERIIDKVETKNHTEQIIG
jgi:thioredoxin-dependent peroxiredoxin